MAQILRPQPKATIQIDHDGYWNVEDQHDRHESQMDVRLGELDIALVRALLSLFNSVAHGPWVKNALPNVTDKSDPETLEGLYYEMLGCNGLPSTRENWPDWIGLVEWPIDECFRRCWSVSPAVVGGEIRLHRQRIPEGSAVAQHNALPAAIARQGGVQSVALFQALDDRMGTRRGVKLCSFESLHLRIGM